METPEEIKKNHPDIVEKLQAFNSMVEHYVTLDTLKCSQCGYCCGFFEQFVDKDSPLFKELLFNFPPPFPMQINRVSVAYRGDCQYLIKDEKGASCKIHNDDNRPEICKSYHCWKDSSVTLVKGLNYGLDQVQDIINNIVSQNPVLLQRPEIIPVIWTLILKRIREVLYLRLQEEVRKKKNG